VLPDSAIAGPVVMLVTLLGNTARGSWGGHSGRTGRHLPAL